MKIGDFAYHKWDNKKERMKLLIVDDLGESVMLCRYIHYRELETFPERRFDASELIEANND